MEQSYELLAPAGNMDCLYAAFSAGADAVYLAGQSFGARAYAGNFSEEELIEALHYAHLNHKKIYLTLNTLIKEKEFHNIVPYLQPYYEEGLDGVIIQDLGLIPLLKENFPDLELHASTQMTVNSYRSAKLLKEQGICRVVPSRELSLKELIEIKQKADIEVEAFIHGALCYCYSGQCLFSSFLGGRSGNRGRCAGPCRLPYYSTKDSNNKRNKNHNKEEYPLSLKDLCSLANIYELMDAGIDSFKIEGRMKSAEYVAGVTAIYRKYMDAYIEADGNRKKLAAIAKDDIDKLQKLYIRSNVQDGYLKKHNGQDMISLNSPSYKGSDEAYVNWVHNEYCNKKLKLPVFGYLSLEKEKAASLQIISGESVVNLQGDVVQSSVNRPLEKKDVFKQINKTGNSDFYFETLEIHMDEDIFLPLKAINELRRRALDELKKELLFSFKRKLPISDNIHTKYTNDSNKLRASDQYLNAEITNETQLHIRITTEEQLCFVQDYCINKSLRQKQYIHRLYVPSDLLYLRKCNIDQINNFTAKTGVEVYFVLPRIFRMRSNEYASDISKIMYKIKGVLVRNLEEIQWLTELNYKAKIVLDSSIYQWNTSALTFLSGIRNEFSYPLELSRSEIMDLNNFNGIYVVYGRIPMMVSANCLKKTLDHCTHSENKFSLSITDRYHKNLPVYMNCVHCYNEVFNPVPSSIHKEIAKMIEAGFYKFRLDFTNESTKSMKEILDFYLGLLDEPKLHVNFPLKDYTTGHLKEGVQ